ncbi:MAG: mandelate racemase/muconate lactonizing enzyme family protein [Burkholderiales bacterium]
MRIKSVQATWLHCPIPEAQQHVSDFGRVASFDSTLVRIETECGIIGWGEAKEEVGSAGNNATVCRAINEKYGPDLIGRDPRDITLINEQMYNGVRAHYARKHGRVFPALGRRGVSICAMGGIDLALWDILGKSLNAPVWRLLGGRKSPKMPAYASGGWADANAIGDQLLGYVKKGGVGAVKMRVGIIDGTVDHSVKRARAAREALGSGIGLACDAHGTWSVAEAKQFCRKVENLDLMWFEEPVTADDKRGCAEVRRSSSVPIATGESESNSFDFRELAELGAADILQPDLAICGGISEAMKIAAIASTHNLRLAPHLWTGAIAFAAGMHVSAATSCGFILEYSFGANPLLQELPIEGFPLIDGMIEIPERPGLGVTVNPEFVKRFAVAA